MFLSGTFGLEFAAPLFADSFLAFLGLDLQVFDDVLLVGTGVSLDHGGYVLVTDVEHAFDLLSREQLIESSQLEVSFLVGKTLFASHQLQMCIHEAIEVQPQRIHCVSLEKSQHSGEFEGGGEFEVSEISHEHGEIKPLRQLAVVQEGLVTHTHCLSVEVEDNQQFLQHSQFVRLPLLLETSLLSLLLGYRVQRGRETAQKAQDSGVVLLREDLRAQFAVSGESEGRFIRDGSLMLKDEVLDGFEQFVDLREVKLSPILLVDAFVNVVVLSELIALEMVGELVELSDGDGTASEDVDEFGQLDVAVLVDALQLLEVLLRLPLLHHSLPIILLRCRPFITQSTRPCPQHLPE